MAFWLVAALALGCTQSDDTADSDTDADTDTDTDTDTDADSDADTGDDTGLPVAECGPLQSRLVGQVDGAPVDLTYSADSLWFVGATAVLYPELGTLLLEDIVSESDSPTAGWLRMPDDSPDPGAWYCAAAGTSQAMAGGVYEARLQSLSRVGACPGLPVSGSMSLCFPEGDCGDPSLSSDVPESTFAFTDGFYYGVSTSNIAPTARIDLVADGGLWVMPTEDYDREAVDVATADLGPGFVIVPEGLPDAGALYCVGEGSTVDYRSDPYLGMVPVTAELVVSRLGRCPGAEPATGSLTFCMNTSE
jgi:hypothetical protein